MKRTLVERVKVALWDYHMLHLTCAETARRIIAMVRRYDRKEKGK